MVEQEGRAAVDATRTPNRQPMLTRSSGDVRIRNAGRNGSRSGHEGHALVVGHALYAGKMGSEKAA